MIEVAVPVTVEFYDVDPMQVVWHGNYPRFLELARRALFESLGYGYQAMVDSGYAWPIIDMHLRYAKSAVLGQELLVKAKLLEWENRAVVEYEIQDAASGLRLTRAHTTQVAVDQKTGELSFVCPEAFQARVRKAMA